MFQQHYFPGIERRTGEQFGQILGGDALHYTDALDPFEPGGRFGLQPSFGPTLKPT